MLNVLLIKIQPMDWRPDNLEFFTEDPLDFKISVQNGGDLQFKVSKAYYIGSESFQKRVYEIIENLGVTYGGHVIAIDKYPHCRFQNGAKEDEESYSGISRYEIECCAKDFECDSVILLAPGLAPIILSDLNFAYGGVYPKGYCPSFIAFEKEAVLSFTSPFGEVIGIALENCNESALTPDHPVLFYTMSFERVSLPPVILQKLLETKRPSE